MASSVPIVTAAAPVLDSDQQKAAAHREGKAAVAAAAGSGKTTLLVGRAIELVRDGAAPASVLTLAFNRNAAVTLRTRLSQHPATRGFETNMASTFHAFALQCVKLVMPGVKVLGTSAQAEAERESTRGPGSGQRTARDLAKEAWAAIGGQLYGANRPSALKDIELDDVFDVEAAARERLFSAGWPQLAADAKRLEAELHKLSINDASDEVLRALALFMPAFREAKRKSNQVDFTDMLLGLGNYIRQGNPAVMTRLRGIRHLQVDEAQDGNELRWYIARTIADFGEGRSVMAVGDLRQSIAGFAGAQPAMFRAWWDEAKQFTLPRNYRSARAIVEAGNVVADGEDWNVGGDAIAARADLGEGSVRVGSIGAMAIGVEVASAINNGTKHKDITVLARTRAALETAAFAIRTRGIKVFVRGGGAVWKSLDGRAVLAYLNFAEGIVVRPDSRERDKDLRSLTSALNRPLRYISGEKVRGWTLRDGKLATATLYSDAERYQPAARVVDAYDALSNMAWAERVGQVRDWLIEGLTEDESNTPNAPGATSDRADLIKELCNIAEVCGSLANLYLAIAADYALDPTQPDVVELSTIHQSKGDQWGTVYVTGVREGVFPHAKATKPEELAEETRLLYVAVTRPVHTLVVDYLPDSRFDAKLAKLAAVAAKSEPPPPPEPEALEGEVVTPAAPPPPISTKAEVAAEKASRPTAKQLLAQLEKQQGRAEALRDEAEARRLSENKDERPGRFVSVLWSEMQELLVPAGFEEESGFGQRQLTIVTNDGYKLILYTSIPVGASEAREVGADSMRVVLLKPDGRPAPRLTPMSRTRNWRYTVMSRLIEALTTNHPELRS